MSFRAGPVLGSGISTETGQTPFLLLQSTWFSGRYGHRQLQPSVHTSMLSNEPIRGVCGGPGPMRSLLFSLSSRPRKDPLRYHWPHFVDEKTEA